MATRLSEYGYSLTQVSGSTSLTIATQPPSSHPDRRRLRERELQERHGRLRRSTSPRTSSGRTCTWGDNSNLSLYAQTAANGVAQLVVPAVPLTVTASESVQVNLTQSQTTVQVNVGGQPVNVTLYYSPNYVYLSASALLIPPQTSLSMVLTAQTQYPLILVRRRLCLLGRRLLPTPPRSQPGAQGAAVAAAATAARPRTTAQIAAIPPYPRVRPRVTGARLSRPRASLASPSWRSARSPWREPSRPWSASRSQGRSAERTGPAAGKAPGFSIVPRERDAWTGPRTSS